MPRSTSSANLRGGTRERRARRQFLIDRDGIPRKRDGEKTRVPCWRCGKKMRARPYWRPYQYFVNGEPRTVTADFYSWEIDRAVCGHDGGTYKRENCRIACRDCNQSRCTKFCRFGALDAKALPKHAQYAGTLKELAEEMS